MVRKFLFFVFLVPTFTLLMAPAQATDQPIILYHAMAQQTEAQLDLIIPSNLQPGYQVIEVSVVGKAGAVTKQLLYFCKTLNGVINWDNTCPDATVLLPQKSLEAIRLRAKLPAYNPRSEPKKTVDLVITSLAALTVVSTTRLLSSPGATKQQGYLSQVAKGGLLLSTVLLGPGDKLRVKRSKASGSGSKFKSLANRTSGASPLFSRILADGNYLRAGFQNLALLIYPAAFLLGLVSAKSVSFQALPPSFILMLSFLVVGMFDSFAGVIAVSTFGLLALFTGHVTSLSEFLTLMGIALIGFSPILLASVFRPLRRSTTDFATYWERVTDYLVAALLTGWVVKQIILGLAGLSGLQLPITAHAHTLGIIAGFLVVIRYGFEDLTSYLYPARMLEIEPEYKEQTRNQYFMRIVMQILVFLLVAEPFLGNSASLWIGLSIFTIPLLLSIYEARLPKSSRIARWTPKGVIEMITMTTAGYLIARVLNWYPESATGYVLTAFIFLGIPGFILKIVPLFAAESESKWRESRRGAFFYRALGSIAFALLAYIIFTGILLSNNL